MRRPPADSGESDPSRASALLPVSAVVVATALLLASAPEALASPDPLSVVLWLLLSGAGGAALLRPAPSAVVVGGILTIAVLGSAVDPGLGVFAAPIALAACAARSSARVVVLIGTWYFTALLVPTVRGATQASDIVNGAIVWLVLLGSSAGIGAGFRALADQVARSRRRRVEDLAAQRRALARELHDTAVRATTEMVMLAESARTRSGLSAREDQEFARISRIGRLAADDLRTLMDELRRRDEGEDPRALGLSPGGSVGRAATFGDQLAEILSSLEDAGVSVRADVEPTMTLPPETGRVLTRCLGEVRANIVRHGDPARPVVVLCEIAPGQVDLVVTNGVRTPRRGDLRGGAGLDGIRERLQPIGGRLEVREDAGSHLTRITIAFEEAP